jgi:hypothetical protein
MVDLNGHEAGNGGDSQRKPTAHRVSPTRKPSLKQYPVIPWDSIDLDQFNLVPESAAALLRKVGEGWGTFRIVPARVTGDAKTRTLSLSPRYWDTRKRPMALSSASGSTPSYGPVLKPFSVASCIDRQCVRVGPHLVRSCGRLGRMGNRRRRVGRRSGSTTSRRSWNWRRDLSAERQWHDEANLQPMQGVRAFETKIAQSAA